jgi:hypothetical protein
MYEMTADEINATSGAISSEGGVGIGLGLVGLGIAIVSGPVGLFGFGVATLSSYAGGLFLGHYGKSLIDNG